MMEEEKLRRKEEQGSDFEEEEEEEEEEEPVEEVELKKEPAVSSLKKSPSEASCDSCEMALAEKSDNNNKSRPDNGQDNQVSPGPLEATPLRKVTSRPRSDLSEPPSALILPGESESARISFPAETFSRLQLREPLLQPQVERRGTEAVGEVLLPRHPGAAPLRGRLPGLFPRRQPGRPGDPPQSGLAGPLQPQPAEQLQLPHLQTHLQLAR